MLLWTLGCMYLFELIFLGFSDNPKWNCSNLLSKKYSILRATEEETGDGAHPQLMDFHLIPHFIFSIVPHHCTHLCLVSLTPDFIWLSISKTVNIQPSAMGRIGWACLLISWAGWKKEPGNLSFDPSKGFQLVFCLGFCPVVSPLGISGVSNSWNFLGFSDAKFLTFSVLISPLQCHKFQLSLAG